MFFSDRDGDADLFEAVRSDAAHLFAAPRSIRELATIDDENDPWVSPDQRHLFFVRSKTPYEAVR